MAGIEVFATVLVPIILGLIQAIKSSVALPKNIIPLVAVVLGLLVGLVAYPFTDLTFDLRLWAGALAGMASVGLFEISNYRPGVTKGSDE